MSTRDAVVRTVAVVVVLVGGFFTYREYQSVQAGPGGIQESVERTERLQNRSSDRRSSDDGSARFDMPQRPTAGS